MQTFLTSEDFAQSARDLDSQRLVKNLLEVRQLMDSYVGKAPMIFHSPAAQMWVDSPQGLYEYAQAMIEENIRRGYKVDKNREAIDAAYAEVDRGSSRPWWWADEKLRERVIRTHRASLYRKRPDLYSEYEEDNLTHESDICCAARHKNSKGQIRGVCSYYWPTHDEEAHKRITGS